MAVAVAVAVVVVVRVYIRVNAHAGGRACELGNCSHVCLLLWSRTTSVFVRLVRLEAVSNRLCGRHRVCTLATTAVFPFSHLLVKHTGEGKEEEGRGAKRVVRMENETRFCSSSALAKCMYVRGDKEDGVDGRE
jgi:hypothetical protein